MKTIARVIFWILLLSVFSLVVFSSFFLKLIYANYPKFQDRFGETTARLYEYDIKTGAKKILYEGKDIAKSHFLAYDEEKGKVYIGRTYRLELTVYVWNVVSEVRYDGAIKMVDLRTKKTKTLKRFPDDPNVRYAFPLAYEHVLYLIKYENVHLSLVHLDDDGNETRVADFPPHLYGIDIVPTGRDEFLFSGDRGKLIKKKWYPRAVAGRIKNGKIKILLDKPDALAFKVTVMDEPEADTYVLGISTVNRQNPKNRLVSELYLYERDNKRFKMLYSFDKVSFSYGDFYNPADKTYIYRNHRTKSIDFIDVTTGKVIRKSSLNELHRDKFFTTKYVNQRGSSGKTMLICGGHRGFRSFKSGDAYDLDSLYLYDFEKHTLKTVEADMKPKWDSFFAGYSGSCFVAWNDAGDKLVYAVED